MMGFVTLILLVTRVLVLPASADILIDLDAVRDAVAASSPEQPRAVEDPGMINQDTWIPPKTFPLPQSQEEVEVTSGPSSEGVTDTDTEFVSEVITQEAMPLLSEGQVEGDEGEISVQEESRLLKPTSNSEQLAESSNMEKRKGWAPDGNGDIRYFPELREESTQRINALATDDIPDTDYFWDLYRDVDGLADSLEVGSFVPQNQRIFGEMQPEPEESPYFPQIADPNKFSEVPQLPPDPYVQQQYVEQRLLLTHYLKEYISELTQNPDSQRIVQQLIEQQPQTQELMRLWLKEQQDPYSGTNQDAPGYQASAPGTFFPNHQSSLQKLVEEYQRLQQQQAAQVRPGISQLPLTPPHAIANTQVSNLNEDVDTFNIVITKNLTGGQSQPTVQYLPDATVDALLLNTSISSVSNISGLKDVVDSAISAAVASNPVAIQEATAQLVESPGHEPIVNVINSTMPNLHEIESTINTLLGSRVVYDEDPVSNTAVGYIPRPDGSVVKRLLNKTIGVENLSVNSTSKTNVVNIFIINIIGGTENESSRPLPPAPVPPPISSLSSGIIPTGSVDLAVGFLPSNIGGSTSVGSLPSRPIPPAPLPPGQYPTGPNKVGQPAPPLPPAIPLPSSFVTQPELPTAAPPGIPYPGVQGGFQTGTSDGVRPLGQGPENGGGINLNNNEVLNLLPDFVKATTIPPVVPLYNTSAHELLGQNPSVLGLLPNQVFEITKPKRQLDNSTTGGIIRKTPVGNLTEFFASNGAFLHDQRISQHNSLPPHNEMHHYQTYDNPNIQRPLPYGSLQSHSASPAQGSPFFYTAGGPGSKIPTSRLPTRHQRPSQEGLATSQGLPQFNLLQITSNETLVENDKTNLPNYANLRIELNNLQRDGPTQIIGTGAEEGTTNTETNLSPTKAIATASDSGRLQMDNLMKAVAIGALPSGIAFATALWPYWAPLILGRRKKREASPIDDRARISHDWLSILTGAKYKESGTKFPSAWDRAALRKNNQKKTASPSRITTDRATRPALDEQSTLPYSETTPEEITSLTPTEEGTDESLVDSASDQETTKLPDDTTETVENTDTPTDPQIENVLRTTEKATTVKRATPASPPLTSTGSGMEQSVAQMISSLTSTSINTSEAVTTEPEVGTEEMKEGDGPADVDLVTKFLYSTLNDWNREGEEQPAVKDLVELEIETGPTVQVSTATNSPIIFINGVPTLSTDVTTKPTTTRLPSSTPAFYTFQPTIRPVSTTRRTTTLSSSSSTSSASTSSLTTGFNSPFTSASTSSSSPTTTTTTTTTTTSLSSSASTSSSPSTAITLPSSSTLSSSSLPNRVSSPTSKPVVIINNQPVTLDELVTRPTSAYVSIQTNSGNRFPILSQWNTRIFATTRADATTTTPTTTTTTTTPPTTTTTTTTTTKPTTTTTTTTTTTSTTTTPTTTTTTEAPGILSSIATVLNDESGQLQSAVSFVGSVAVYGAAALMPLWLPIVLGKRRRRRDLEFKDDLQEIVEAVRMIHSLPPVPQNLDFGLDSEQREIHLTRKTPKPESVTEEKDVDIYEQYPVLKHLVHFLKKELKNRAKNK